MLIPFIGRTCHRYLHNLITSKASKGIATAFLRSTRITQHSLARLPKAAAAQKPLCVRQASLQPNFLLAALILKCQRYIHNLIVPRTMSKAVVRSTCISQHALARSLMMGTAIALQTNIAKAQENDTFDINKDAKEIRDECLSSLTKLLNQLMEGQMSPEDARKILADLQSDKSVLQNYFDAMYQKGEVWVCHWLFYLTPGKNAKMAEDFANRVIEDFNRGFPHAYPMMANMLAHRSIFYEDYSLIDKPPFNDVAKSVALLKDLAAKGVEDAQIEYCKCLKNNSLGSNELKADLQLSTAERMDGIKTLAYQGVVDAQKVYLKALVDQKLGDTRLEMSDDMRHQAIAELLKLNESKEIIDPRWLDDKYSLIHLHLSQAEGQKLLEDRVKKGDFSAVQVFINRIYNNKEFTDLPAKDRLKKLLEFAQQWPQIYEYIAVEVVTNSINKEPLDLSIIERLRLLQEGAVKYQCRFSKRHLTDALYIGSLGKDDLNLYDSQRLNWLHDLAKTGNRYALEKLMKIYSDPGDFDNFPSTIILSKKEKRTRLKKVIHTAAPFASVNREAFWFLFKESETQKLAALLSDMIYTVNRSFEIAKN